MGDRQDDHDALVEYNARQRFKTELEEKDAEITQLKAELKAANEEIERLNDMHDKIYTASCELKELAKAVVPQMKAENTKLRLALEIVRLHYAGMDNSYIKFLRIVREALKGES